MAAILYFFDAAPGSRGRIFCPIFIQIWDKVPSCLPVFAIDNQQNRLVTSANMPTAFQKIHKHFFSKLGK